MDEFKYAPWGWQCPVCRRVYSPTTLMCLYCHKPTINDIRMVHGFDPIPNEFKKDKEDKLMKIDKDIITTLIISCFVMIIPILGFVACS